MKSPLFTSSTLQLTILHYYYCFGNTPLPAYATFVRNLAKITVKSV